MAQFTGTYKHERDDNLEQLFIQMGMNFLVRKLALRTSPTIEVKVEGDNWTISTIMSIRTLTWTFKLGEETIVDGTNGFVKVIFTLDGDRLVQTPVDETDEKAMTAVRHFTPQGMTQTMVHKASGTTAVRHFKKA
ncbi:fatty acid-binding protein-like isoform X2 [Panulirus ornatus]